MSRVGYCQCGRMSIRLELSVHGGPPKNLNDDDGECHIHCGLPTPPRSSMLTSMYTLTATTCEVIRTSPRQNMAINDGHEGAQERGNFRFVGFST